MASIPAGVTPAAWNEAVKRATGDRVRLARLVARGLDNGGVERVSGQWQLPIPSLNDRGSDTIRPNKKNKRKR